VNRGCEYVETVGREADGHTVLEWLSGRYRHSSPEVWRARIEGGEVRLGDRAAAVGDRLRSGTRLVWRRPPWNEPVVPLGFAILHRDAHLLAVAKPRGLPTVPNGGFLEHTLLHRVRRLFPEAVPLHRLGRGTSGLVLFARTAQARRVLAGEWRAGRVEKEYRALVAGVPTQVTFTVEARIGPVPHPRLGSVHGVSAQGRRAVSHVRVVETRDGAALVAVGIPTGRPHQIRIHLAAAGHPLLGDPLYAAGGLPRVEPALPGAGGYWLHAYRLRLRHPATGEWVAFECGLPPILRS